MTESRLDRCRQDFKVQNRTSVSLPSTEGGAALPGGSEAQPTGPLRGKVPRTAPRVQEDPPWLQP